MKKISKEMLKECANRLYFDMNDEEIEVLKQEFETTISQMELIGKIKGIDDVEPMTFPFEVTTSYLRDDIAGTPLDIKDALKNANSVKDGQIKLPKVVI